MERYSHHLIEFARDLRKRATPAEKLLWERLRNRELGGYKFVRQHHIGAYIADFYCRKIRLVVELEGSVHDVPEQKIYDEDRFEELAARGVHALRFRNQDVLENIDKVLETILKICGKLALSPSPKNGRGFPEP